MANAISTTDKLVSIGAYAAKSTPVLDKLTSNLSSEFAGGNSDTIRVEVNSFPTVNDSMGGSDSDIRIPGVDLKLNPIEVKIPISATEETLDIDSWDRQVGEPTGVAIASRIEKRVIDAAMRKAEFVSVGTGTFTQLDDVHAKIRDTKLGKELVGFGANRLLAKIRASGIANFGTSMGKELYSGWAQNYDGVDYFNSSDIMPFSTGVVPSGTSTLTAAVTAQGATQLAINNMSAASGTVKKYTVIRVAGANAVNLLGEDLGVARDFIVLADATVTSSAATVTVAPIYFAGATGDGKALQNVSLTQFASGTAVTSVSAANTSYLMGVVFDPRIVVFGAKGFIPYQDQKNSRTETVGKMVLRYGSFSDGANGSQRHRWDGLFGAEAILGKGVAVIMCPAA